VRATGNLRDYLPLDGSVNHRIAGFGWVGGQGGADRERDLLVPAWFAAALFATLPAFRLYRRIRRRRRHEHGHSTSCGYDLRATPGRCPECGAVPSVAAPARPE
jgi:hypothetical protein